MAEYIQQQKNIDLIDKMHNIKWCMLQQFIKRSPNADHNQC